MKKKSIKSLSLNKVVISNLAMEQIKGMGSGTVCVCPSYATACHDCNTGAGSTKCCEK